MAEIIELKRKAEKTTPQYLVWECNCGSQTFKLIEGGAIFCSECGGSHPTMRHFDTDAKL